MSIVVACRNEAAHVARFLDSLGEQDMTGLDWEAILADGMSDDGTPQIVRAYCATHPRFRLIDNPNGIVSMGLNAAIRLARGDILLRMDVHTRYAPDYCRKCIEILESTGADNVGGPARTEAQGTLARAIAAAYHSRFSTGGGRFHDERYRGWVDTVPYGCWRRATFHRVGLFDGSLVRNQDDELNLRLRRAGGRIWQDPEIRSWYSPRATLARLFQQYFQYGFWKVPVIRKHRVPGSWRHLAPGLFVAALLGLPAAAALCAVCGARERAWGLVGLWLGALAVYAGATLVASLCTIRRAGWRALPYLPAVFATYHSAYGLGFLAGLLSGGFGPGRFGPGGKLWRAPLFTRLTR